MVLLLSNLTLDDVSNPQFPAYRTWIPARTPTVARLGAKNRISRTDTGSFDANSSLSCKAS
jgi:hypothetical protein